MISVFVVIAGLMLGGGAIALRVVSAGASKASPIIWLWIGGAGVFVLFGTFLFGVALGRRDAQACPHCHKPVDVRVNAWSGRLRLDKGL
jgi:hypothetical protein